MKITNSIRLFLEHCQFEKNLSHKTIEAYQTDLLQFESFLKAAGIQKITRIDKQVIKSYVQELSKYEIRTTKRKIASAKAYLNFLEFEDYIPVNPFRKVKLRIKEPLQLPTVLDLEEVKQLFQLLQKETRKVTNKKSYLFGEKLRDLAILELLFATGIRVSELCGLKPFDINLKTGHILVRGKGSKERVVQICNSETTEIMEAYYQFYKQKINKAGFFLSVG